MPLLEVAGVTLEYRTTDRVVTATRDVSFRVDKSDRFVILGPSGCGKSTILKAVAGFVMPVEGRILLNGAAVTRPGPDRIVVFQEFDQLLPWKTVKQNVTFALTASGKLPAREAEERARRFLEKVKLSASADSFPHTLSGGMKQRVAIARAMAMEPQVLLMDEPFAALDALTRDQLNVELLRLWQQIRKTVILVTHSIPEAVFLSDRVLVISDRPGTIIEDLRIDLPRPRDPTATKGRPDFSRLVLHLGTLMGIG
jgi:NitT/TauT family transport system ATP-binding protein